MEEFILLQCGDAHIGELLATSRATHEAYATRHGGKYVCLNAPPLKSLPGRHPHWLKIAAILQVVAEYPACPLFVYLDADTLIREPQHRPQDVLTAGADLGLVWYRYGMLNTGVVFWRGSEKMRAFWQLVHETGVVDMPKFRNQLQDETAVNYLLEQDTTITVQRLESRWNKHANDKTPNGCIIEAWHGQGLRPALAGMRERLAPAGLKEEKGGA